MGYAGLKASILVLRNPSKKDRQKKSEKSVFDKEDPDVALTRLEIQDSKNAFNKPKGEKSFLNLKIF